MLELGGVLVGPFAGPDGSQRLLRVRRLGETSYQVRELMHVQFTPLIPMPSLPQAVNDPRGTPTSAPLYATTAAAAVASTTTATTNDGPTDISDPAASPTTEPTTASHTASASTTTWDGASGGNSNNTPRRATRPRPNPITIAAPIWSCDIHHRFPTAHRDAVYTLLLLHSNENTLFSLLPKEVLLQELLPKIPYAAFSPKELPDDDLVLERLSDGAAAMEVSDEDDGEEGEEEEEGSEEEEEGEEEGDEDDEEGEDVSAEGGAPHGEGAAAGSSSTTTAMSTPLVAPLSPPITRSAHCGRLLRCL